MTTTDNASAARGTEVSLTITGNGVFTLTAVPETSLALTLSRGARDGTAYPVTLAGPVRGFPSGKICTVVGQITPRSGGAARNVTFEKLPLDVQGAHGSITLTFDLIDHGVFEASDVHFRVTPVFPFADEVDVRGALALPHTLRVEATPHHARVGDIIHFTPVDDPLFNGCALRLQLEELDEAKGERADATDLHGTLSWRAGERAPIQWRVGCTEVDGDPVLTYPEADEAGDYEIGTRVELARRDGDAFLAGPTQGLTLTVARPSVGDFQIETEPTNLLQMIRDGSWQVHLHALVHHANIRVRGRLAAVGIKLQLPLEIDLWTWRPLPPGDVEQSALCTVEPLIRAPIVVRSDVDGTFDAVVHAFGAFDSAESLGGFARCFAVLRIPPSVTGTHDEYLQVHQVLGYDDHHHMPLFDAVIRAARPGSAPSARLARAPHSPREAVTAIASRDLPHDVQLVDNRADECPHCREDVTPALLRRVFAEASASDLEEMAAAFNESFVQFEIDRCARKAHFFAQIAVEVGPTGRPVSENLAYRESKLQIFDYFVKHPGEATLYGANASHGAQPEAIANRAYAGRNGNGDVESGDGWRYRGRGFIQLTGRGNYLAALREINRRKPGAGDDLVANPDALLTPRGGMTSAMAFWSMNSMNSKADGGTEDADVDAVTRVINQHTDSYPERRRSFAVTRAAFDVDACTTP